MATLNQWCASFSFRDAKGQTRKITVCFQADLASEAIDQADFFATVFNLVPLLQACTNAHVSSQDYVEGGSGQDGFIYGTTGDYQSVAQQLRLYYLLADPNGNSHAVGTVTIPAPLASLFEADLVTVNPTNAAIVALNGGLNVGVASTAGVVACSSSGLVFASFIGGAFVGKKLTRRFNKFTKDPTLTIAGI